MPGSVPFDPDAPTGADGWGVSDTQWVVKSLYMRGLPSLGRAQPPGVTRVVAMPLPLPPWGGGRGAPRNIISQRSALPGFEVGWGDEVLLSWSAPESFPFPRWDGGSLGSFMARLILFCPLCRCWRPRCGPPAVLGGSGGGEIPSCVHLRVFLSACARRRGGFLLGVAAPMFGVALGGPLRPLRPFISFRIPLVRRSVPTRLTFTQTQGACAEGVRSDGAIAQHPAHGAVLSQTARQPLRHPLGLRLISLPLPCKSGFVSWLTRACAHRIQGFDAGSCLRTSRLLRVRCGQVFRPSYTLQEHGIRAAASPFGSRRARLASHASSAQAVQPCLRLVHVTYAAPRWLGGLCTRRRLLAV